MKKLFIILLSVLSLTTFAQTKKTVAVLDPICRDNSVNAFFQQMVRGAMESAVTASNEYEAYDRSAFDMIQKEQAFQRTGAVSDSQIKKMGEMAGVDYVLVSEVSAYEGYLSAVVKILNVTTGKYDKSIDDYTELKPDAVKNKCKEMASSLFGLFPSTNTQSRKTAEVANPPTKGDNQNINKKSEEYIDLGLPSGTLWKSVNENCGTISYNEAMSLYGDNLPSMEQFSELISSCSWIWIDGGYKIIGPNNNQIFLPVGGFRDEHSKSFKKTEGFYWSSTPFDMEMLDDSKLSEKEMAQMKQMINLMGGHSFLLTFNSKSKYISTEARKYGMSIRLVK